VRELRFRFPRTATAVAVPVAAILIASCSGWTTGATNIAKQPNGLYSAQLNFVALCRRGEHCSWYVRYRRVGTRTWAHVPATPRPIPKVQFFENVTGLTAGAQYEYQLCGNVQPGLAFICVGPDGTFRTTTKFPTRPTVTSIDAGGGSNVVDPNGGGQVTISGTAFSTAPGATTFDFGDANPATGVTCSSTTQCSATVPPYAGGPNPVDVVATVDGLTSLPNPPNDQAIYFGGISCGCGGD